MKRIYIAGPYAANNEMNVLKNIRNGIKTSVEIMKLGYSPFCPWLDFHFILMDFDDQLKVEDFYKYSLDWLAVSDAILLIDGWQISKGSLAELKFANENNIPIFYSINDLLNDSNKTG